MTTIAFRKDEIAADTGAAVADMRIGHQTKIAKAGDAFAGAAGAATYCEKFLIWFAAGQVGEPPEAKESERHIDRGAVFHSDGSIRVYEPGGSFPQRAEYYALGSGKEVALGAMAHGATAEEAVRAAMKHDAYTFGDVEVLKGKHGR